VRHVGDEAQLVLLGRITNRVALGDGGEPTLGGERELLARAISSSGVSTSGFFVETSPSTTCLSSGTFESGSNDPERASSYSRKYASNAVARSNSACAMKS
jgi:hypothetical protein